MRFFSRNAVASNEVIETSKAIRSLLESERGERSRAYGKLLSLDEKLFSFEEELRQHKERTDDQYHSAYARTAEVHYRHAMAESQHRREQEKTLLERWQSHVDSLHEQIGLLSTENGRLSRMLEQASDSNKKLQERIDEAPRLYQIRDWLREIMDTLEKKKTSKKQKNNERDAN
tara:strand:- start:10010 stop:10531 length:522 start_codon:yes stop_codon:yes gene_type:complete